MMICIDASLIIKWITPEEDSEIALKLYEQWNRQGAILIAPTLLDYEVGSTLVKKISRGLLPSHRLNPALHFYKKMPIQLMHEVNLLEKAVSLARDFDEHTLYDCSYLSLALWKEVDFYTCDLKFYQKTKVAYPCVKYFDSFQLTA